MRGQLKTFLNSSISLHHDRESATRFRAGWGDHPVCKLALEHQHPYFKPDIQETERDLRADRIGEVRDDHLKRRYLAPGGVTLLHGKTPGGDLARETVVQLFAERMVQFDRMHNRPPV
jgi:hypothetical protein